MKKLLAIFALILLPVFVIAPVYAQVDISDDVCSGRLGNGVVPEICNDIEEAKTTNPIYGKDGVLTNVLNALSIVVGVVAVIVIMISGINMTLSQGDPQKVAKARNQIIYAAVGVAIAVVTQSIVQLVLNRL
jgi:hypothetical protein